ncbi:MAG: M28 family peptidase [Cyanobacteria bacterium J06638_20]
MNSAAMSASNPVIALPDIATLRPRLQEHLTQIVRDRDPYLAAGGHFFAREYIRGQLAQWGEVTTHDFKVRGQSHQNLILHLPASQPDGAKHPMILIGAHFDTVPNCPGADDNASGVAVLLELAAALAQSEQRSPLQLVAFDMEEYGLQGSASYAAHLRALGTRLRLMFSLEMLGYCTDEPNSQTYPPGLSPFYPDQGNFIALVGNWKSTLAMMRLSRAMQRWGTVPCRWLPAGNRGLIVPDTRRSDHAPFWDEGYPAVMVTDTSFLRNPHYHKPSDRIETLDLKFMAAVCRGLIHNLARL